MWDRVKRVLQFDSGIFREVALDNGATGQACIVFTLAIVLGNIWVLPVTVIIWPLGFAGLAMMAGIFLLVSRQFADGGADIDQNDSPEHRTDGVPGYSGWLRAILFASAPMAFGVIPLFGTLIGGVFNVILQVVAIRDVARIPTGAAVMSWVIGMLLPAIIVVACVLVFGISIFGMLGLGELLN